jgi:hypothetical protein
LNELERSEHYDIKLFYKHAWVFERDKKRRKKEEKKEEKGKQGEQRRHQTNLPSMYELHARIEVRKKSITKRKEKEYEIRNVTA